jgi:hypothetical protein
MKNTIHYARFTIHYSRERVKIIENVNGNVGKRDK